MNSELIISKNIAIFQVRIQKFIQKECELFQSQLIELLNQPEITETEVVPEPIEETLETIQEVPEIVLETIQEVPEVVSEPEIEVPAAPEKPKKSKAKKEKSKCSFVLKSGKNKGEECGKNAKENETFCAKHSKKSTPEPTPSTLPDQILQRVTIEGQTVLTDGVIIYEDSGDDTCAAIEVGKIVDGKLVYN